MSEAINVISRTQTIIVDARSGTVSIVNSGPIGPRGPEGPAGPPGTGGGGSATFPIFATDGVGIDYRISNNTFTQSLQMETTKGAYSGIVTTSSDGTDEGSASLVAQAGSQFATMGLQTFDASGFSILTISLSNVTFNVWANDGDPNGSVFGNKGDLLVDPSTPALWQNTTGSFSWSEFGSGGGGGGFPITDYDGTYSYGIGIGGGDLLISDQADTGERTQISLSTRTAGTVQLGLAADDGTNASHITVDAGYVDIAGSSGCTIGGGFGLLFLNTVGANDISISAGASGGVGGAININGGGNVYISSGAAGDTVQITSKKILFVLTSGSTGISFDGGVHIGHTPIAVTGSRAGNAALASLLTALTAVGMISNGTSA